MGGGQLSINTEHKQFKEPMTRPKHENEKPKHNLITVNVRKTSVLTVDSLGSLGGKQLVLGELKVLLSVAGARPARHPFPRLHLCRVVEAEVVVPAQNHTVALATPWTGR